MKIIPLLFLVLGLLIIWLGVNGKIGAFMASIFTPGRVEVEA